VSFCNTAAELGFRFAHSAPLWFSRPLSCIANAVDDPIWHHCGASGGHHLLHPKHLQLSQAVSAGRRPTTDTWPSHLRSNVRSCRSVNRHVPPTRVARYRVGMPAPWPYLPRRSCISSPCWGWVARHDLRAHDPTKWSSSHRRAYRDDAGPLSRRKLRLINGQVTSRNMPPLDRLGSAPCKPYLQGGVLSFPLCRPETAAGSCPAS